MITMEQLNTEKFPTHGWCRTLNPDIIEYLNKTFGRNSNVYPQSNTKGFAWHGTSVWRIASQSSYTEYTEEYLLKMLQKEKLQDTVHIWSGIERIAEKYMEKQQHNSFKTYINIPILKIEDTEEPIKLININLKTIKIL